jgi:trigger factor
MTEITSKLWTALSDRYTIERELGSGGMATVYLAEDLKPIAEPLVRELTFDEGEPPVFQVSVAVKPELDLQRLGGFDLIRKTIAVTDEMAEAQLEQLRGQHSPWVPVEGASPHEGELALITIKPLGEEGEAAEGSQYQVVIGHGQALPDVEDQLKKMLPGDSVDTTVTFPDDFHEESKRG